jgi:hypothetical protein
MPARQLRETAALQKIAKGVKRVSVGDRHTGLSIGCLWESKILSTASKVGS